MSGRKYNGGSITMGKKRKSLQELKEHGESVVKISKVKAKSKKKVMVMKTTPKIIPLPFLDDTPAEGTRRLCKKKEESDAKPVVHE